MNRSVFFSFVHDGTGFAITSRFAKEGYTVFIGSRKQEKAEEAAQKIQNEYGVFSKGYSYQTETLDETQIRAIFDDIRSEQPFQKMADADNLRHRARKRIHDRHKHSS